MWFRMKIIVSGNVVTCVKILHQDMPRGMSIKYFINNTAGYFYIEGDSCPRVRVLNILEVIL
jgi:hypothetical protein